MPRGANNCKERPPPERVPGEDERRKDRDQRADGDVTGCVVEPHGVTARCKADRPESAVGPQHGCRTAVNLCPPPGIEAVEEHEKASAGRGDRINGDRRGRVLADPRFPLATHLHAERDMGSLEKDR